jgi:hypothetical protein
VRFSTDDRVTVTDPAHWNYGQEGIVQDYEYALIDRSHPIYLVELDVKDHWIGFTVDQLDFTEEAPSK